MSSVQIRDVRKSFGNFEVLHGVSIPIEDGEFVVLVGPSGCGKSTLLRMLAGLENITSGTISIGDRVVNNVQPKERDIAMTVFQNYALYPHDVVADNTGLLPARSCGAKSGPRQARREILALPPLERYRQLIRLKRRIAAHGPPSCDPGVSVRRALSNLDAKLRVAMRTEIRNAPAPRTTTVSRKPTQSKAARGRQIVVIATRRREQIEASRSALRRQPVHVVWKLHRVAGDELPQGQGEVERQRRL
jgi:multiple sugar transport system ATP-binding protein